MLKKAVLLLAGVLVLVLAATAARAGTLDQIKKRGFLTCGSNLGRAGFSLPDGHGHWAGLDIDFCRALAAAIFGDAGKVKFIPLTAKDRFAALQSGAVDVLASNTTWTLSRETKQGLLFAGVNYSTVSVLWRTRTSILLRSSNFPAPRFASSNTRQPS